LYPCQVRDRGMAREFAAMLYGAPVRVRGPSQWERSADGVWKLVSMNIEGWDVLEDESVVELFERLRASKGIGWKTVKDPDAELKRIREGK